MVIGSKAAITSQFTQTNKHSESPSVRSKGASLSIRMLGPFRSGRQEPAKIGGLPNVSVADQVHAATNHENNGDRHAFLLGDFLTARNRP